MKEERIGEKDGIWQGKFPGAGMLITRCVSLGGKGRFVGIKSFPMKKAENYLIVLNAVFLIIILVLSYMYISSNQEANFTHYKKTAEKNITFTRKTFENLVLPTDRLPNSIDTLDSCINHFDTSFNKPDGAGIKKFPTGVWVEKNVIAAAFNDSSIDGFTIIPVRYPFNMTSPNGYSAMKGKVSFIIMLTKLQGGRHVGQPDYIFNYNNPCPNPKSCPN